MRNAESLERIANALEKISDCLGCNATGEPYPLEKIAIMLGAGHKDTELHSVLSQIADDVDTIATANGKR